MIDETTTVNLLGSFTVLGVLWRIVWYQGTQILKLTKRQDEMWEKCFGQFVDDDTEKL